MDIDRRSLIVGVVALVATSCGQGSDSLPAASGAPSSPAGAGDALDPTVVQVVRRFPTTALTPGRVRLPVSLGNETGVMRSGPDRLSGRILNDAGDVIVDDLVAAIRSDGLANPHWSFVASLTEVGIYTLQIDGANPQGAAFQVNAAATVRVPQIGQQLPAFETPTIGEPRGVDPVCTRDPQCGLHEVTITDALSAGKPIVYLIGTPAYCQTGVCGPMLDFVLRAQQRVGDAMTFVHTEIYTDSTIQNVAPAVTAYSLDYEPVIFFTNSEGTIVERLDTIADAGEIDDALALGA